VRRREDAHSKRRQQIDRREKENRRLREKYRSNAAYRRRKLKAARRQTKRLSAAKKGELSERRCAQRFYARVNWKKLMDEQPTILYWRDLAHPTYIVESPGRKTEIEQW
jgi:hypothetical protein